MTAIEYHPEAAAEFELAAIYYESRRDGLGAEFTEEVLRCVELISEFPGIGSYDELSESRHFVTRRFPYVIHYVERAEGVRIVAVSHGSRRPGYWRQRLE